MNELMFFLQYIVMSLDGLSTGIMMEILYRRSNPKRGFMLGRVLSYWLLAALICLPSYLLHYKIWPSLNLAANIAGIVYLNIYYYHCSFKKAFLAFFFYIVTAASSELITLLLFPEAFYHAVDWTQNLFIPVIMVTFAIALIAKISVALLLSKKKADTNSALLVLIWLSMAYILAYFLVIFSVDNEYNNELLYSVGLFIGSGFSVLAGIILSLYVINTNSNRKLNRSLELSSLQKKFYEQLRQNHQDILVVRDNYSNAIGQLIDYVQNHQTQNAIELAGQEIMQNSKKKKIYCANQVVNAIVLAKEAEARKAGISLTTELLIPEDLIIDPLDLCRILGNLLDNAIRSCIQFQQNDSKKSQEIQTEIVLKGRLFRDLLVITCRNTALKNKEKKIYGQGYGQQILQSVAKKYDGNFCGEYAGNGCYEAIIHLVNQKPVSEVDFSNSQTKAIVY